MDKVYGYDEAFQASLDYFNGDDLAAKSFLDKYSLRNNKDEILEDTPEKMHWRLAKEFARIESKKFKNPLSENELFNLFDRFQRLIPQGSPMFGIGNNFHTISISNCFVLDTPEDSYNSILDVDKQLVNISKRRGGVGIDLSKLRPKGSVTHNAAKTSTGIISWMERYSNSIREVGQHGRRGALMLTLSIHHPDILDFATVKNDNTKVTGANISVRLTKEFLDAVKNDSEYELRFPVDYKELNQEPKVSKFVKAKEIWKSIIHSAWLRAEPGLLMWDNVLGGPADCYEEYKAISTNPCVTGDTKVLTKKGHKRIDKLVNKSIEIWNGYEWSKVTPKITGFNKEIIQVGLSNGKKLKCTQNHYFILADENRIQCRDLKIGDILFGSKDSDEPNRKLSNPSVISLKQLPKLANVVYCFTEPKRNLGTFNGILTGQCSEIAMCSLESCRLLAINLFGYVKNPFTKDSYFDYEYFYSDVKIAQRLMDDIVDLESEKIDQILTKIKNDPESKEIKKDEINLWTRIKKLNDECRRTGLGITALGDTLAAIGIKYGSKDSVVETEKIYQTLKLAAYESSIEMAEELGSFKDYDSKKEENNDFILRIKEEKPDLYKKMVKFGRRNIALTTTAPTGTVSIMAQSSSGIEPVFNLSYKRRKKINPNDKNSKIDFTDQSGDSWQEFIVYHPKLKLWMEVTGKENIEKSPWFGCTANEIDWINRVKLQAAAQKHVCHAISSTINLPEDVTEEKVAEIYETAFASGIKGITIYRENCRTGVLINKEEKKNDSIQKTNAPKRPKSLKCDVHHIAYQDNRYYSIVGLLNEDPYEVFVGLNNDGEGDAVIPKSIKSGELIKESKGKYVLKTEDFSCVLKNTHTDENADVLARLLSTSLRHGSPLSFVIHQLEKTKGGLTSFSKILCRVLKKYIKDGTVVTGENCPQCSSVLVRESGCQTCKNCGWSKC